MHVGAVSSSATTNMVVSGVWPGGAPATLGGPRLSSDHQINVQQSQRDSMGYGASKGLLNGPGQNNCFLNCAVQQYSADLLLLAFRGLLISVASNLGYTWCKMRSSAVRK
ncbi:LOC117566575 [Sergentomyia squamirostris]